MPYEYCPRCGNPLHKGGVIRPNVSFGKKRNVQVYVCWRCGYRVTFE